MTRINLFRTALYRNTPVTLNSVAWGKTNSFKTNTRKTNLAESNFDSIASPLIFAALLIVCSLAVGCSSDKPQPTSSSSSPITQPTPSIATNAAPAAPLQQAAAAPAHKKVVRRVPATVTYADKASGVSFQYPRKYALKTGDAAAELVSADPIPMDFTQPGGVTLAAVALPQSAYPNSDLALAYFNVSVNKNLTADQCSEFSVPQTSPAAPVDPTVQATAQLATPPSSKLMIGDMELQSTETNVAGDTTNGPREESAKYYHVFQNGACYEFALKVATTGPVTAPTTESTTKHIDRDEVFHRLEKILATVKINPVPPEVNAEAKAPAQPAPAETPAQ